jgi:hypothetical protein
MQDWQKMMGSGGNAQTNPMNMMMNPQNWTNPNTYMSVMGTAMNPETFSKMAGEIMTPEVYEKWYNSVAPKTADPAAEGEQAQE